jgi:hypothetical protein
MYRSLEIDFVRLVTGFVQLRGTVSENIGRHVGPRGEGGESAVESREEGREGRREPCSLLRSARKGVINCVEYCLRHILPFLDGADPEQTSRPGK